MTDRISRRRALACLGTSITLGVAGCSGDGGGTTDTDGDEPEDDSTEQETDQTGQDEETTDSTEQETEQTEQDTETTDSTEQETEQTEQDTETTDNTEPTDTQSDSSGSGSTSYSGGDISVTVENTLTGLEFVSFERIPNDTAVAFITTIRNTGSSDTNLMQYNYEMTLYDSDGNVIDGNGGFSQGDDVPAGESGTIRIFQGSLDDADAVARAEVITNCDGLTSDGVYCES